MFLANAQVDLADKMLGLFEPYWFWAMAAVIVAGAAWRTTPTG